MLCRAVRRRRGAWDARNLQLGVTVVCAVICFVLLGYNSSRLKLSRHSLDDLLHNMKRELVCCSLPCSALLCSAVLCRALLCCAVLCCAVLVLCWCCAGAVHLLLTLLLLVVFGAVVGSAEKDGVGTEERERTNGRRTQRTRCGLLHAVCAGCCLLIRSCVHSVVWLCCSVLCCAVRCDVLCCVCCAVISCRVGWR
jgi:hypothetical protein